MEIFFEIYCFFKARIVNMVPNDLSFSFNTVENPGKKFDDSFKDKSLKAVNMVTLVRNMASNMQAESEKFMQQQCIKLSLVGVFKPMINKLLK